MPGTQITQGRLTHGGLDEKRATVPRWDMFVECGPVRLEVIREAAFEVHFQAAEDCITMPLGFIRCDLSVDSD